MQRKQTTKPKSLLFFILLSIMSWYQPGIFNKTIDDLKLIFKAFKSLFF